MRALAIHLMGERWGGLSWQFIQFGLVGVAGLVVDTAVLYGVIFVTGLNPYAARLISFLAAATTTWALNRAFTFKGEHQGRRRSQWARFVGANAFGGIVNYALFAALIATNPLFADHPILAVAAGSLAGMVFNFVASKKLVFRSH